MAKKEMSGIQPEAGLAQHIAEVVDGAGTLASLSDSDLETAIQVLHRCNPPRIIATDRAVAEFHKRRGNPVA